MSKIINGRFLLLILLFIIAAIMRVVFDANRYINNIVAAINVIALLYVVYIIVTEIETKFKKLLNETYNIGKKIKNIMIKKFKSSINFFCIILPILGILYICFMANSICNDIISLLALVLSIETEYISSVIGNYYSKKN